MTRRAGGNGEFDPTADPGDLAPLLRASVRGERDLPDVVTFAEHPSYLGGENRLYPRQRVLLRIMNGERELMSTYEEEVASRWAEGFDTGPDRIGVSPDLWDRMDWLRADGYERFSRVVFIGGRRAGKGHLGAIMSSYLMYRLIAMGDPQSHYGIPAGKLLSLYVTATTFPQARDNEFADLLNLVTSAACFSGRIAFATRSRIALWTDRDLERIKEAGITDPQRARAYASVRAAAVAPTPSSVRGAACFGLVLDEFAHHVVVPEAAGVGTDEAVYRALTPSLAEMHRDGWVYIATSPYGRTGMGTVALAEGGA